MLSCFPVVADPSTVEQWWVPFPLAKQVAELVSPLLFPRQSRSNSLNAYFRDLCLEGQNLSSHFAFSRACSVIFLFTICKRQDDFEKLYIMLYDCFSSRDPVHFVAFRGGILAFPQSKYQTKAKQVPSLFPSSQLSWPHRLLRRCTARPTESHCCKLVSSPTQCQTSLFFSGSLQRLP